MKTIFFAVNRHSNTACVLTGWNHWEMVQMAFRVGIGMPNGERATGIGRCKSLAEFMSKARHGNTTILEDKQ